MSDTTSKIEIFYETVQAKEEKLITEERINKIKTRVNEFMKDKDVIQVLQDVKETSIVITVFYNQI